MEHKELSPNIPKKLLIYCLATDTNKPKTRIHAKSLRNISTNNNKPIDIIFTKKLYRSCSKVLKYTKIFQYQIANGDKLPCRINILRKIIYKAPCLDSFKHVIIFRASVHKGLYKAIIKANPRIQNLSILGFHAYDMDTVIAPLRFINVIKDLTLSVIEPKDETTLKIPYFAGELEKITTI